MLHRFCFKTNPLFLVLALASWGCGGSGGAPLTPDAGSTCGNGRLDNGETCDPTIRSGEPGACPSACSDGDSCTRDFFTGSTTGCDLACEHEAIQGCAMTPGDAGNASADGSTLAEGDASADTTTDGGVDASPDGGVDASPDGATVPDSGREADDSGVPPSACGNGVLDPNETCDGTCPTSVAECDDSNACTTETFSGSAAACDAACGHVPITRCIDGDGCCAPGCNSNSDNDCTPVCGNGALEQGETCDGACPTTCDDGDACTEDTLSGDPSACNAECTSTTISACANSDGCCPSSCTFANDDDCAPPVCGNGQLEVGELCDGNCPTSCNDEDPCTADALVGSSGACDAHCVHTPVSLCASGDGCCGLGCSPLLDDECGVGRAVGDSCLDGEECVTRACRTEAASGWTGGYCTADCRLREECDATSDCARPADASSLGVCLKTCQADADCRDGYVCMSMNADPSSPKGCVFPAP
ncbi:MAG: hypothetical protein IPK13_08715 [Deltaproteobacteria bacterium]|nr:hypothetical protein [Deltaproteobacteria bacterium]